jgi:NADH-quinone oxidoreductase subunit I
LYLAFAHLFRSTFTVKYPFVILGQSEREFGARHVIDKDRCISCSICVRFCPTKAVKLVEVKEGFYPQISYAKCIFCQICVDVCPRDAILRSGDFELATCDKPSLTYSPNDLFIHPDVRKGRKAFYLDLRKPRGAGHRLSK